MKNITPLQVFKWPCDFGWKGEGNVDMRTIWEYWSSTERDAKWQQIAGWTSSKMKVDGSRPSPVICVYARPFCVESKGKSSAENFYVWAMHQKNETNFKLIRKAGSRGFRETDSVTRSLGEGNPTPPDLPIGDRSRSHRPSRGPLEIIDWIVSWVQGIGMSEIRELRIFETWQIKLQVLEAVSALEIAARNKWEIYELDTWTSSFDS
jgi:hypothetical protein